MVDVRIPAPAGDVPAYVAEPLDDGPWPGVVVIHDAFGMTDDLRNQADWLASGGFLAAAPDLFHWGKALRCIRAVMRDVRARQGRAFDDVDAVRAWLAAHDRCRRANGRLLGRRRVRLPVSPGSRHPASATGPEARVEGDDVLGRSPPALQSGTLETGALRRSPAIGDWPVHGLAACRSVSCSCVSRSRG